MNEENTPAMSTSEETQKNISTTEAAATIPSSAEVPGKEAEISLQEGTKEVFPDQLQQFAAWLQEAVFEITDLQVELPERRGKKHGLKISSLKKNQDDFQLEIEVKGKKRAFSFSFSKNNDKYTFYSDTLPDHHAKKVWIENIRFDPENKAFEIGKSSSNTLTSYREVMSYWFNIKRPNMEYADQEVKPDSPQGIFLDFLSKNWPVYDVDGWKNVDYFIKDIFRKKMRI